MKNEGKYTLQEITHDMWLWDDSKTGEKNCIWMPYEGDLYFGRSPFRALASFSDKWLYACASLVEEYNDDTYKELLRIVKKYVPTLKKIELPKKCKYIPNKDNEEYNADNYYQEGMTEEELNKFLSDKEEQYGIEINYWTDSENESWRFNIPDTGSVDEDILSGFLKKENITLEEFISNKKYVVIQDGDETCYFSGMKEAGLINMDAIDHEYPEGEWWER
jgi:hypothetical protein